ncbi:MAG: hypothetical protein IPJ34_24580 [Myxococcales bacterium]|nr:hypothetical protein [Myxococcales bacterium]
MDFSELLAKERAALGGASGGKCDVITPPSVGEPYVAFTTRDDVGIALSGGGIRSATFNLGVLQSLDARGILQRADYVASVSGGGYLGSACSAQKRRHGAFGPAPDTVRHMREFSRFLAPRPSFLATDIWHMLLSLFAGMGISLTATLCLVMAATISMRTVASGGPMLAVIVAVSVQAILEIRRPRAGQSGADSFGLFTAFSPLLALPLVYLATPKLEKNEFRGTVCLLALAAGGVAMRIVLAAVFGAATGAKRRSAVRAVERTAFRLFLLALVWALIEWSLVVTDQTRGRGDPIGTTLLLMGGASPAAAGALVAFRKWFFATESSKSAADRITDLPAVVRRQLPGLLAGVAILGAFAFSAGLSRQFQDRAPWYAFAGACVGLAFVVLLFDAPENRIHELYRSRIARAYVGASRAAPEHNRASMEEDDDDLSIQDLAQRPLQLVCCAANNLRADGVATLSRGARSAALSACALQIGDEARPTDVRLSSAVAASAAAVNSLMGTISIEVGPSVGFVLAALGLRLGLWLPHPSHDASYVPVLMRPWLFLHELLGLVTLDEQQAYVHLSDGGHFENLALYELVRRHCRYLIVCDASADADRFFDDLANAIRLVRTDFGVEIELDVAPLRSDADGFAKQHAVIGTVHYDGKDGFDKGSLIYFKPTLTGDEPPDLLQYRSHNPSFPHESTAQQFYDEAQWESYRRLGQHAADEVFRFVESFDDDKLKQVEPIFSRARRRWMALPAGHDGQFLELTQRWAAMEERIAASPELSSEVFLELDDDGAEAQRALLVASIAQLMEDAWIALDLEHTSTHPLHRPWLAYMERWASMPTFLRYFPLVAPTYNDVFVKFVQYRLGVGPLAQHRGLVVRRVPAAEAAAAERRFAARTKRGASARPITHEMTLTLPSSSKTIQVGVLRADESDGALRWNADELFVPEALMGGGFHSTFLEAILDEHVGAREARVKIHKGDPRFNGRAGLRQWRVSLIDLYKSVGFRYASQPDAEGVELVLAGA